MKKSFFLTITLFGFLYVPVWAQRAEVLSKSSPEMAGFDAKRLGRLDVAMNDWANKQWMNGGSSLNCKGWEDRLV